MGVTLFYQAIPEQSTLFTRLKTDDAAFLLFTEFYNRGSGPFLLADISAEEMSEVQEHLGRSPEGEAVFETVAGIEKALASLDETLQEMKQRYPGIEYRTAMLEKNSEDLYEFLAPFFQASIGEQGPILLRIIMDGSEQAFTPPGVSKSGKWLGLVSADRVQQAGKLLQPLTSERVFAEAAEDQKEWLMEDYEHWRNVYLLAAQNDEAMIVGL